jgi:hypothetical protein
MLIVILTITVLNYVNTHDDKIQSKLTPKDNQPVENNKPTGNEFNNISTEDINRLEYKLSSIKDVIRSYRDFQFFKRDAKPPVYRQYYDESVCFAIVTPTYRRKDDTTIMLISETIDAVLSQTYTNWKWFIIGDYYENESEITNLLNDKIPENIKNKVVFYNMPEPGERGKVDPSQMWNIGGRGANNVGIEMLKADGLHWYTHLDDDDPWEANHLQTLYHGIKSDPKVNFVNTQAKHRSPLPLPFTGDNAYIQDFKPVCDFIVHSTWCINIHELDMNYNVSNFSSPADSYFIHELNDKFKDKLHCAFVPMITLDHSRECGKKEVRNFEKLLVMNTYRLYDNPGWMEFSSDPMMINKPYIDLSDIPYQDSVFFYILLADTIYDECKYKRALLQEVCRILNKNGILFLQSNTIDNDIIKDTGLLEINKHPTQELYIYQAIEGINKDTKIHAFKKI